MAKKWLLVRGVPGKLVPVTGERGNYYGMKSRSFPDGKRPAILAERYEPCDMVVPWSIHLERAVRERMRGDGAGNLVDARDLHKLGKCSAPDRATATAKLMGERRAEVSPLSALAATKRAAAKAKAVQAKALQKSAEAAAEAAREADNEAARAELVAEAVAGVEA